MSDGISIQHVYSYEIIQISIIGNLITQLTLLIRKIIYFVTNTYLLIKVMGAYWEDECITLFRVDHNYRPRLIL